MHSSINEQLLKHDKDHDVKMQTPGKASDITKAKNVLAKNDNNNKSLICSVAQLKDHVLSDVKSGNKSKMPIKAQLNDHTPFGRMLKKHDATESRHL
eukprot:4845685-Ditylum_brightwellii.AAC.1